MRIAHVIAQCPWGELDETLPSRGCGGREGAVVELSLEWAREGHEVVVFCPRDDVREVKDLPLTFVPFENALATLRSVRYDGVVAVELPELLVDPQLVQRGHGVSVAHHQVAHVNPNVLGELNGSEPPFVWGALSRWHGGFMIDQGCRGEVAILQNGVHPFGRLPGRHDGGPRFLHSSSPDRGLHHMLDVWLAIRDELPDAELFVAYGARRWCSQAAGSHFDAGDHALSVLELLELPGVTDVGLLGARELRNLQATCHALLYPCDTGVPTETGCNAVLEALAAGMLVHTTDCDCLEEEYGTVATITPLPWSAGDYVDTVLGCVTRDPTDDRARNVEFAERRTWGEVAKRWLELFATSHD